MSKPKQRYCHCGNPVYNRKRKCDECKERDAQPKGHKCHSEFQCENIIYGRKRICPDCLAKREEAKRWKICNCGQKFRLKDGQSNRETVCPDCREENYNFIYKRLRLFIDNPEGFWGHAQLDYRMWMYASKGRNDVQSTSGYPSFKKNYRFFKKYKKAPTWDHINSMTYILYHYLRGVLVTKEFTGDFPEFKKYYDKYAVQFPITGEKNQSLKEYQKIGIIPEEYANEVGEIMGLDRDKTISTIKDHFIFKDKKHRDRYYKNLKNIRG